MPRPIQIEALVDQVEQPGVIAAAEQLHEALTTVSGERWPVQVHFHAPGSGPAPLAPSALLVASFLPEIARLDDPWPALEARCRALAASAVERGYSSLFLCTIFRRVADRSIRSAVMERIRRLDLLAIEISHDLAAMVVDIDRTFAHIGGRSLQCDCRPTGRIAAEVYGYSVARSLLSAGLDEMVPPDLQERAKDFLGELQNIDALVNRRLNRPR